MSKGDHQLIKAFHKQVNIVESMMKSHMEVCPELAKSSELNEELAYLYKLAKTLGERMRELALFRGMVMSLRQENAKLRAKSKEIAEKEETNRAQTAKIEQEIPLPFVQSRFSTQRIDILNKKNLTRKQKEDITYPKEQEGISIAEAVISKKTEPDIPIKTIPEEKIPEKPQEPSIDPMDLLAEQEKNIRAMMKKYKHISDTVVLPLTPGSLDSSSQKENGEAEEEEILWPKPTTAVAFSSKNATKENGTKEKIIHTDNDLKIDLILIPEEVDVAIKLPQEASSTDATQKILDDISSDEEYLGEKEVLKLLQIEKEELQQMIERGDIHFTEQDGNIFFHTQEVYNLRAKTMELETIMLEKKKMKKSISRLQKFYRDQLE